MDKFHNTSPFPCFGSPETVFCDFLFFKFSNLVLIIAAFIFSTTVGMNRSPVEELKSCVNKPM